MVKLKYIFPEYQSTSCQVERKKKYLNTQIVFIDEGTRDAWVQRVGNGVLIIQSSPWLSLSLIVLMLGSQGLLAEF